MSLSNLVGDDEPASESIRALLSREWNVQPVPVFMSRFGAGNAAAGAPVTANDRRAAIERGPTVYVRDGAATPGEGNNDFVEISTVVYIDIFDESRKHLTAIRNEVDRIIFAARPNTSTRIPKSDGTDSAITYIDPQTPTWQHIDPVEQLGITEQYAGEIEITTQRNNP